MKPLGLFISLTILCFPLRLLADPNINIILSFSQCSSCHGGGGSPSIAANEGGLDVVDPATSQAVQQYEPGKTYEIRFRFQGRLFGGAYRNAYLLWLDAGDILDDGQIGLVQGRRNARVVTSAVSPNTMSVAWRAPASGNVLLSALRMETNNNEGTGGNLVSQAVETISLTPLAEAAPSMPSPSPTSPTPAPAEPQPAVGNAEEPHAAPSTSSPQGGCVITNGRVEKVERGIFSLVLLALSLAWLSGPATTQRR